MISEKNKLALIVAIFVMLITLSAGLALGTSIVSGAATVFFTLAFIGTFLGFLWLMRSSPSTLFSLPYDVLIKDYAKWQWIPVGINLISTAAFSVLSFFVGTTGLLIGLGIGAMFVAMFISESKLISMIEQYDQKSEERKNVEK